MTAHTVRIVLEPPPKWLAFFCYYAPERLSLWLLRRWFRSHTRILP